MAGQRIGYLRVSTLDRNEKRQLEGQVSWTGFSRTRTPAKTLPAGIHELLRFARDGETVYQYLRHAKLE